MRFRLRRKSEALNGASPAPIEATEETPKESQEAVSAAAVATSTPIALRSMKAQASGADSRAERFVRQVRGEVHNLRDAIAQLSAAQDEMLELDLAEVQANPAAAAALPGPVLVKALTAAADQIGELERQLAQQQREMETVRDRLTTVQRDEAWLRGRMETLEDVIGALHSNLEDLRIARDIPAQLDAPRALPASQIKPARKAGGEGA